MTGTTGAPPIVEFLTARLDQIEARENRRTRRRNPWTELSPDMAHRYKGVVDTMGPHFHSGKAARWSEHGSYMTAAEFADYQSVMFEPAPDRAVLADIASKRKIIEWCRKSQWVEDQGHVTAYAQGELAAYRTVLLALAEPFSGHPDYQQEWRPTDG